MANLEKYKEAARKFEAKEQWAKAIEQYSRAIEEMEGMPEIPEAELPLYNKVGDLCARVGDSQQAVSLYEHAIDKYHEIGLANNAIALCNKVIRLAPGRAQIYLKLGMLFASKGFGAEAKTNLLEYADRMQKAGQIEEAFKALKKVAEMTPGQDEIWSVLVQQARASARTPDKKEQVAPRIGPSAFVPLRRCSTSTLVRKSRRIGGGVRSGGGAANHSAMTRSSQGVLRWF